MEGKKTGGFNVSRKQQWRNRKWKKKVKKD
jgi:hypothetical protein